MIGPSDELLACPFCDQVNVRVKMGPWQVECGECGAEGPACTSRVAAIAAWANRPRMGKKEKKP